MRGIISDKLKDFMVPLNEAIAEAKAQGIGFEPAVVRANLDKLSAFIGAGPDVAVIENRAFNVDGRTIDARVYHPSPYKKLPVLLHFHGGGHMCGSVELYDTISRKIAHQSQCIVITVGYRLAPEHPYPAAIDDCQHALINYRDVLEGMLYGDDVYILGDSAGGAICTTLTMNSQRDSRLKIDKQILIYPSVDYTMNFPSIDENGQGFLLEKDKVEWYFDNYFQREGEDRSFAKQVSPLHAEFDKNMPETLIFTGGCDMLRDEGFAYVEALKEAGVAVKHQHFEGMIHAYMLLHSLVEVECDQTYAMIADFIKA